MIPILDASDAPVRLPLWSDPAITEANRGETPKGETPPCIKRFIDSGDVADIVVPPTATFVVMRPLSAKEFSAAERSAGRKPHFGAVVSARKSKARKEAGDIEKPEGAATFAKWIDALSGEEFAALEAYEEWDRLKRYEVGRAACVRFEHVDRSFTFDEFIVGAGPTLAAPIAAEVALRAQQLSGMGDRPKGLSDSAYGLLRQPESAGAHGDATSVAPSEGASAATAAGPSQPA